MRGLAMVALATVFLIAVLAVLWLSQNELQRAAQVQQEFEFVHQKVLENGFDEETREFFFFLSRGVLTVQRTRVKASEAAAEAATAAAAAQCDDSAGSACEATATTRDSDGAASARAKLRAARVTERSRVSLPPSLKRAAQSIFQALNKTQELGTNTQELHNDALRIMRNFGNELWNTNRLNFKNV